MADKVEKWIKAKFWIAVYDYSNGKNSMQEENGETKGFFGIHGHAYNYGITHLPTGYAINSVIPEGLKRTKKNLQIMVAKLEAARVDWDNYRLWQIKGYKGQVLAIKNNCKFGEFQ